MSPRGLGFFGIKFSKPGGSTTRFRWVFGLASSWAVQAGTARAPGVPGPWTVPDLSETRIGEATMDGTSRKTCRLRIGLLTAAVLGLVLVGVTPAASATHRDCGDPVHDGTGDYARCRIFGALDHAPGQSKIDFCQTNDCGQDAQEWYEWLKGFQKCAEELAFGDRDCNDTNDWPFI